MTDQALTDHARAAIEAAIAAHGARPGPTLEILHAIQQSLGYVPAAAVPIVAAALNLTRAEVHGVVTFYHHFRHSPPGKRTLRVCRAEACQAAGGAALQAAARQQLGVDFGGTTRDGAVSLEPVFCLGLCACAPAVMLDEEVHGRVTPERLAALLAVRA